MDIKRYKKFALSKINEGNLTRGVKSIIKNEKNKEQNYKEGINPSMNRRNLENLNSLISDVSSNRSKYNIRDDIVDNLEMLNYNLLRLINKPPPVPAPLPQPIPPAPLPQPIPPAPQLLPIDYGDDDDDNFVFPPPPPPIDEEDDFVFPPPPPPIDDDEGDPFPTLPLPLPAPINTIIPEARSRANLLDEIRNPKIKLKPKPPTPPKEPTLIEQIRNPKINLKPPKPLKPKEPILEGRDLFLDEIRNPKIKLKPPKPLKPQQKETFDIKKTLTNTFDKIMQRRSAIQDSSDEDEEQDWGSGLPFLLKKYKYIL